MPPAASLDRRPFVSQDRPTWAWSCKQPEWKASSPQGRMEEMLFVTTLKQE